MILRFWSEGTKEQEVDIDLLFLSDKPTDKSSSQITDR
jgi:hypothetical protein